MKDAEKHLARARKAAVQKALEKAQLLADASNLKLGPALSIEDESVAGNPRSVFFPPADPFGHFDPRASDASFVMFQPEKGVADALLGQIQLSVMVRVVYETSLAK